MIGRSPKRTKLTDHFRVKSLYPWSDTLYRIAPLMCAVVLQRQGDQTLTSKLLRFGKESYARQQSSKRTVLTTQISKLQEL